MRPIGIYGGTFDPVHIGHLRTALEVCEWAGLDHVRMVPARVPPHRDTPDVRPEERLALLRAAVEGEPRLVVDTRELERDGPSYMVDTLASLRDELGATPLALVLGMDAFAGLPGWHRWGELFDLAHLVVVERPGARAPADAELEAALAGRRVADAGALAAHTAGRVVFTAATQLDISATRLRALLAAGRSIRYLFPYRVHELIKARGLYAGATDATD